MQVRWGDKHGGYGEHYWEYNHGPKHDYKHHDHGYKDHAHFKEAKSEPAYNPPAPPKYPAI